MSFTQFFSIVRARWIGAGLVLLLTVGLAVGISLMMTRTYTATATVVADVRTPDPIAGMVLNSSGYQATQIDIIQSERVALRVVQSQRLNENAEARDRWLVATGGRGSFDSWLAGLIKARLDAKPSRDSNVISISYTHADPAQAAVLANAFVRAYIEVSIGLRASPAKQYGEFFDGRAKEMREALEQAQAKLTAHQKSSGILATDDRFDIENQRLNELSSQLVSLQAIAVESSSRSAQALQQGDKLQDVITNSVVAGLRSDISRQEARLQELNAKFGDAHPQVVELRANIDELKQRIAVESARVTGSVGVTSTINRKRESEVRVALDAQRARVLSLKQVRDEAAVLQREVETAQRAYEQVAARATQSSLESQSNQTNVSLLTAASEPNEPSSPRTLLNTVVSTVLGLLLAVGYVFMREMTDRRVRTLDDVSAGIGLPVLGALPKPARTRFRRRTAALEIPGNLLRRLPRPRT